MQDTLSPAAAAILAVVAKIPKGKVATYGQVATIAGLPRRARLVGTTLKVEDTRELPWHRVLRADGRIAFPAGSAAFDEQRKRLKREGVVVNAGKVALDTYGWRRDRALDDVLWGPDVFATSGDAKPRGASRRAG